MDPAVPLRPEAYESRFHDWVRLATGAHRHFRFQANATVAWTPLARSLRDCTVALLTTGGLHLEDQPNFDLTAHHGDWSFREIPAAAERRSYRFAHAHYDHSDADTDPNCIFPLDRLVELAAAGEISGVAPVHWGMMGFIPDPTPLLEQTLPRLVEQVRATAPDVVVLSGG